MAGFTPCGPRQPACTGGLGFVGALPLRQDGGHGGKHGLHRVQATTNKQKEREREIERERERENKRTKTIKKK